MVLSMPGLSNNLDQRVRWRIPPVGMQLMGH
jgi:hypothetical protein